MKSSGGLSASDVRFLVPPPARGIGYPRAGTPTPDLESPTNKEEKMKRLYLVAMASDNMPQHLLMVSAKNEREAMELSTDSSHVLFDVIIPGDNEVVYGVAYKKDLAERGLAHYRNQATMGKTEWWWRIKAELVEPDKDYVNIIGLFS